MCRGEDFSCAISIITSILLGALGGILFFLGIVEEVTIALIVSLVTAFLISIFLFVLIIIPRYNSCIINSSCCLVIGLIGILISSIIALSIDLTTTVFNAFLIGTVIFFLSLVISKFFSLLECVIRRNIKENDDEDDEDSGCGCSANNTANFNNLNNINNTNFRFRGV